MREGCEENVFHSSDKQRSVKFTEYDYYYLEVHLSYFNNHHASKI